MAVAGDAQLNFVGWIFEQRQLTLRRREHRHRPSFANSKRALNIGRNEMALQAERVGNVLVDYCEQIFVNPSELLWPRPKRCSPNRAGGYKTTSSVAAFDQSLTSYPAPRV